MAARVRACLCRLLFHPALPGAHAPQAPRTRFCSNPSLHVCLPAACRALILDVALMELQDATTCDLVAVGARFEPMEQATAFPPGFNNSQLLAA